MRPLRQLLAGMLLGAVAAAALAADLSAEDEQRYRRLVHELRCLVCQNQSIAESNAPLAEDLRRQVRRMLAEGRTDAEIMEYMTERYGDFVRYRPPLDVRTALLWGAPALLLACGLLLLWGLRRRARPDTPVAAIDAGALRRRLEDDRP